MSEFLGPSPSEMDGNIPPKSNNENVYKDILNFINKDQHQNPADYIYISINRNWIKNNTTNRKSLISNLPL